MTETVVGEGVSGYAAVTMLQHRRAVRRSFAAWCRHRGYEPALHHQLIIRSVEEFLASDEQQVLLVFAPPGSAKSSYASVLLPPWYLANHPRDGILFATHSVEFAERWGRRVRNDIAVEWKTLGIALSEDNKAAGRWSLQSGGEYYAVGAGTGISGYRADLAIIDDPFGSREDAYSETVRKGRWNWYLDDFSARLKPEAKRICIATRWHAEDISGMILEQIEKGQIRGRVISIAAIAEEDDCLGRAVGEYLWDDPAGYNYGEFLRARQRETSPMMWSALYQQRPAPEEGDYFKAEWLVECEDSEIPERERLTVYGASDYAVTADGGDYTVHVVVGIDPNGRMYLLDVWRKQAGADEWVEAFCDLVREWRPMAWAEEQGQIRAGVGPFLDRRQRERSAYVPREGFPTRGDKSVRAQSIRGRMALDKLYVPRARKWYPAFRTELLTFPAGKYDDQCLAEGTLISMADGTSMPIEDVWAGDMVATPYGPCLVEVSGVTNDAAQVYRVVMSDGWDLTATGNHPVFVEGKGFTRVDALCIMDQIRLEPACARDHPKPRLSNIEAIGIDVIRTVRALPISAISTVLSHAVAFFTGICGKMLLGQSRSDMTFTTATAMPTTTLSQTLNVSVDWNTDAVIRWRMNNLRARKNTWSAFVTKLKSGMLAQKDTNGILSTDEELGKIVQHSPSFAPLADQVLKPTSIGPCSVPVAANNAGLVVVRLSKADTLLAAQSLHADAADETSSPNGQKPLFIAQRLAACVTAVEALSKPVRVRNLTVSNAHTFYANGMLTHNCDAMGLCGQLLDVMVAGREAKQTKNVVNIGYRRLERQVEGFKTL